MAAEKNGRFHPKGSEGWHRIVENVPGVVDPSTAVAIKAAREAGKKGSGKSQTGGNGEENKSSS